MNEIEQLKN